MATSGGQPGNNNAGKNKDWREAIRKALARDKKALERVANQLIKMAAEGDMAAIKELGDRVDGKAKQETDIDLTVHQNDTDNPPRAKSVEEWVDRRKQDLVAATGATTTRD